MHKVGYMPDLGIQVCLPPAFGCAILATGQASFVLTFF